MAQVTVRVAEKSDDAALCRLMEECPMGKRIRVTFRRRGGFFIGAKVQSEDPFIFGAFEENGRAIGIFSAGNRRVWIDGELRRVRYLSDLRIHPEHRNGRWLARGFREVNKLLGDGFGQTLVLSDNKKAKALLTSHRAGLPIYHPAGEYRTLFFGKKSGKFSSQFEIRKASRDDSSIMQDLHEQHANRYHFSPVLDFSSEMGQGYFQDLQWEDFYLAFYGGQLIAMVGVWDQSHFKQLAVESYSPGIVLSRRLIKYYAGVSLPKIGEASMTRVLTSVACRESDQNAVRDLVGFIIRNMKPEIVLMAGFDSLDPVLTSLKKIRHWSETGTHYLVGKVPDHLLDQTKPVLFDIARI